MSINIPYPEPVINFGDDMELEVHRRNTVAFIEADPVILVLQPRKSSQVASGGFKWEDDGEPREPETMRLIPSQDRTPELKTSNGRMVVPTFTLLGNHQSEMRQWDTFTFRGVDYEIATPVRPEHTNRAYQRKGDVVRRS